MSRLSHDERHVVVELIAAAPPRELVERRVGKLFCACRLNRGQQARQTVVVEKLASRISRLDDAVRVEQQAIARVEGLEMDVGVSRIRKKPEEQPVLGRRL